MIIEISILILTHFNDYLIFIVIFLFPKKNGALCILETYLLMSLHL